MAPVYLVSRWLDPPFMLLIGSAAAWLRIRRESPPRQKPSETFATLKRRINRVDWRGLKFRDVFGPPSKETKNHFGLVEPPNNKGPGWGDV